jgi:Carboxypeptidase regulatory-like domain
MSAILRRLVRSAFILALFVFAPELRSQDASTGAIRGTVFDPDNRAVAAAAVAIVNTGTGISRSALTDADGRFAMELLPPVTTQRGLRSKACRRKRRRKFTWRLAARSKFSFV